MKKLLILLSLLVIGVQNLLAGTVSFDQLATSADLTSAKYNSDLNTIYQKVNSNIQTDNIANDTVAEVDMADDANPRIRTAEGASCSDFVYTGLLPSTTVGTLTGSIPAGTAYPDGYRVVKSSATPKTFTASRWTWVDLDINGDYQYSEVAIGGATPAVAANSVRLFRVSTDGTQIGAVLDLRNTSCSSGPFSIIKDSSGEASLGDILSQGNGGFQNGLNLVTKDGTSVTVQKGSAYINGEYRSLTSALDVSIASSGSSASGISGIDTGSVSANTNYYLYAVADLDATTAPTILFSSSSSAPSGATNYRRLGEVSTDGAATFASADTFSISYQGKIRQIKRVQSLAVATGTNLIPVDDSLPLITEGDEYLRLPFTATSTNNILKIDVDLSAAHTSNVQLVGALFKGSTAVGARSLDLDDGKMSPLGFTRYIRPPSTDQIIYSVRAGGASGSAGTFTLNGEAGARVFGGAAVSSLTITEIEQ